MIVRYCESDRHNTPAIFQWLQWKTCCRLWEQHRFDMIVRLVFHTEITDWISKSRALHNYYAYKSHQDHPSRTISVDTYKSSPLVNKIRTFGLLNSASNSSCSLLRSVSVPFRRFELIIQEKNCISKLMNKIIHLLLFDGRIN